MGSHGAVASYELGEETVSAIMRDFRSAPIRADLRLTLGFLEKLTRNPEAVQPEDVASLRDAGLSDAAIEDAIQICAVFQVINRIADAMEFHVPAKKQFARAAPLVYRHGYGVGRFADRPTSDE